MSMLPCSHPICGCQPPGTDTATLITVHRSIDSIAEFAENVAKNRGPYPSREFVEQIGRELRNVLANTRRVRP